MAELTIGILGLVGVIDVCHQWGARLIAACEAVREADRLFKENIVQVEACWYRIRSGINILRGLESLLDDGYRSSQQDILEVLESKMHIVETKLRGLLKRPKETLDDSPEQIGSAKPRRLKYAFARGDLGEAITELEKWEGIFCASWNYMMKIPDPEVDRQLELEVKQLVKGGPKATAVNISAAGSIRRAIRTTGNETGRSAIPLTGGGLVPNSITPIPLSPAKLARRANNGNIVILETVTCASNPHATAAKRDIRNFAERLKHADPFVQGLLECKGILQGEDHRTAAADVSFVFRLPDTHTEVQSLRHRLLGGSAEKHDSLSERLNLAQQLVNAISYVHLYEFVHKNIRPETVLLISQKTLDIRTAADDGIGKDSTLRSETAVLVGFDVLRDVDGRTLRLGDDNWEKNLYRHPRRQGRAPPADYEIRHDIYSLGVCLLEIGLWDTFVVYDEPCSELGTKEEDSGPFLGSGLGASDVSGPEFLRAPDMVKGRLLSLARGKLRRDLGTKYSRLVETCLTCLDSGNEDFEDETEFRDELGIAAGVRYTEKVARRLAEIVV